MQAYEQRIPNKEYEHSKNENLQKQNRCLNKNMDVKKLWMKKEITIFSDRPREKFSLIGQETFKQFFKNPHRTNKYPFQDIDLKLSQQHKEMCPIIFLCTTKQGRMSVQDMVPDPAYIPKT